MTRLKINLLVLTLLFPLLSLSAQETWVSLNGVFRSYTQNESYDSSIDKTTETDLGYGLKGMHFFNEHIGAYASINIFTPQSWDLTYTDGDEDDNDLSTGMDTATGFGYMLGVAGTISPTDVLDFYMALGYAGTKVTLQESDSDDNFLYKYESRLRGVGTDFGVKLNVQESVYLNVGTSLIVQLWADEEMTDSDYSESGTSTMASLDVRPYFGFGISF
ncbi:MAG: hypothetical protein PQJ59_18125 [Spirochaetales bacterium]|nr:hypothetical protein [Spirochaetales bacterium]